MTRLLRFTVVLAALLAVSLALPYAQGTAGQKPPQAAAKPDQAKADQAKPDQAKPPAAAQAKPPEMKPEDYPADFKAFNEAAKESDPLKLSQALQKFIEGNPNSILVSQARMLIQQNVLTTLKTAQKTYLDAVNSRLETARKNDAQSPAYRDYNSAAGELLSAGVLLDEAEGYARTGLSMLDEPKYIAWGKQMDQRMADSYAKRMASPQPATPPPAAGTPPRVMAFSMGRGANGGYVARPMLPTPPSPSASSTPPRPPQPPHMRTDEELRTEFRTQRASAQATLGQILLKRGKTDEGEKVLKDAWAAKPPSNTMTVIARALLPSAKKANDDKAQMEYLTVLALGGRITADELKDFQAAYRKAHGGSLDGIDDMLDARYRAENPKFEVTPFTSKAKSNGRAVLVEMFTGAG